MGGIMGGIRIRIRIRIMQGIKDRIMSGIIGGIRIMAGYRPGEKAEHLQGTGQRAVSRQQYQYQEHGNPERETGTDTGAGQKKQLSASGITVVYKCVTRYSHISYKVIPAL